MIIGEMFDTQAEATLTDDEWAEILHEYMQGHTISSVLMDDEMLSRRVVAEHPHIDWQATHHER